MLGKLKFILMCVHTAHLQNVTQTLTSFHVESLNVSVWHKRAIKRHSVNFPSHNLRKIDNLLPNVERSKLMTKELQSQ